MSRTYSALLRGDRLEWTGEPPITTPDGPAIPVSVVVPDEPSLTVLDGGNDPEKWKAAVEAARRLAARGTFAHIKDPVEWQREIRKDRPLIGREDE